MLKDNVQAGQKEYRHWIDLSADNIRSMLFALIGNDFGLEPEKRIPDIKESRKNYTNYIADQCQINKEDIVLDLGSGCGFGTYWLAQRAKYVYACDISPAYLEFASKECLNLDNISFHLIKPRNLDLLNDNSIDVICSISVFIHFNLYDIYWYFKDFERIVRPKGRIWIDVADSEYLEFKIQNKNVEYFLMHAECYKEDEASLQGIMQWNSLKSVIDIADHFGFQNSYKKPGGELLFTKRAGM